MVAFRYIGGLNIAATTVVPDGRKMPDTAGAQSKPTTWAGRALGPREDYRLSYSVRELEVESFLSQNLEVLFLGHWTRGKLDELAGL